VGHSGGQAGYRYREIIFHPPERPLANLLALILGDHTLDIEEQSTLGRVIRRAWRNATTTPSLRNSSSSRSW
jgi:hypothetical protein